MRKDKKFAETEYAQNPLYRRMKERFSVEGQVTIGDFMRNRARRDGYTVSGGETTAVPYATGAVTVSAPTAVVSAPVQSAPKKPKERTRPPFQTARNFLRLLCAVPLHCPYSFRYYPRLDKRIGVRRQ